MRWLLDSLYAGAAVLTAPLWIARMIRAGKIRTDWAGRFGHTAVPTRSNRPRILLHAVSVGEINAIRHLVRRLAEGRYQPQLIISVTTDTGFARARELFGAAHTVVRYPFDFSFAVRRFLDAVQPDLVALVELELWPNFIAACDSRDIPVCVINGRLTERSYQRYRRVEALVRRSFARLRFAAAQNETYAHRFRALGTRKVVVTGTMKWDTAEIADTVDGSIELGEQLGIDRSRPLVVAGSTAPGEHELLVQAVPMGVQLLCAPRKPEWFEQAAAAMPGCARRTRGDRGSATDRFLLDTIGELRQAYALADVVVVGRSFGNLHGSDMMEPIALGKPTIVGPAVSDFQDTAEALLAGGGLVMVSPEDLGDALSDLLGNQARREALVSAGREVIRANQGATDLTARLLEVLLSQAKSNSPSRREARTAKEKKEERTW